MVGPSNRLAFSAAHAVAETPGVTYNPLFLYSGAGLGKTHLLQAIGRTCAMRGMSVLYVTSEQFTNEFIAAIRSRTTEDFRKRYRSVQMLLVDDVQFLSGKEQTHEGFFHTFNDIHNSGHQVVVSSDRPPRELPLMEERLRSRFEWGLIADIQPPDLETRMAILASKADEMHVGLEDAVLELIAKRVQRNVRELEGSLNRMVAYSQMMNVDLTLDTTEQILNDVTPEQSRASIDPQRILSEVAKYFWSQGRRPPGPQPQADRVGAQAGGDVPADSRDWTAPHAGGAPAGRTRPLDHHPRRRQDQWRDERGQRVASRCAGPLRNLSSPEHRPCA